MPRTNSGTATVAPVVVPITGNPARAIYVQNESPNQPLYVRVPTVHGAVDFDKVNPGDTGKYYDPLSRITSFEHKTLAGTADFNQGILIGGMDENTP